MANAGRERAPKTARQDVFGRVETRSEALTARSAAVAVGELVPGVHRFVLSKGAIGFGDLVRYALEVTGPADLFLSTWAVSDDEIEAFAALVEHGAVRSLRLLTDGSLRRRHPAYLALLRSRFGADAVRLALVHAKLATVVNDAWAIVVRGSGNLNANRRLEFFELSDDRALATLITGTLGEWFAAPADDQWTRTATEDGQIFAAWREASPAAAEAAPRRDRERTRPRDRATTIAARGALQAAVPEDAAFFTDDPFGVDLRRTGVSYL